ncbi:SDR family NAD(P)-dependent oxidoreductase [Paraburkholderia phymatum]|uniref:SDR family NAD(P)-dependent oxidoreductase n=1 Tax=Paraburkholderia phymatum TaxID=148447 RepID=UPI00317CEA2B
MDLGLKGRRALVTGSSSGIGAGIAEVLADEGATLFVHGRDAQRTEAIAARLRKKNVEVHSVLGDLGSDAGAHSVIKAVLDRLGGVDILVNNAGGSGVHGNPAWFDVSLDTWLNGYSQNVGAIVRLCHAFVPGMQQRGWGRIVNIGSGSGMQPLATIPHYGASKAALNNLTLSLSKALSHTGITVNTISPGAILTPALEAWIRDLARQLNWGDDWATIERRYTTEFFPLPVARIGRVEDIGNMVALIASDRCSYVTGANIRVDCGHASAVN